MGLMSSTRNSYVYAGDALRRRARIKKMVLLALVSGGLVAFGGSRKPSVASAEPSRFSFALPDKDLQAALDSTKGELDLATAQLERANKIIYFSSRYRIGADLASAIFDTSPLRSVISPVSIATSVPVLIAIPMSAFLSAGVSLTPSPVTATIVPCR